jgi:hypothetical protein
MELYRNRRDGRLTWLCRGLLAAGLAFLLWAAYGLASDDVGILLVGVPLGCVLLVGALAIAAYGRKFALSVEERDGELLIRSWRLFGEALSRSRVSDAALGEPVHLRTGGGVPTETSHAWLSIDGGRARFLLDLTDDAGGAGRLAERLARAGRHT